MKELKNHEIIKDLFVDVYYKTNKMEGVDGAFRDHPDIREIIHKGQDIFSIISDYYYKKVSDYIYILLNEKED